MKKTIILFRKSKSKKQKTDDESSLIKLYVPGLDTLLESLNLPKGPITQEPIQKVK
jgi:hypothetical protein